MRTAVCFILLSAVSIQLGACATQQPKQTDQPRQSPPITSAIEGWDHLTSIAPGPQMAIGEYAAGCLQGASKLPEISPDYVVVRPSRLASYGEDSLLKYIETISRKIKEETRSRVIVQDLSRPRGGPYSSGHGSHQIGLDVDLSLTLSPNEMSVPEREKFSSPSFVINRKSLKPSWGGDQVKLVSIAANENDVDRIFVSPAIKNFFCENYPKEPWLYKLRAWWGHEEHIHVRLKCPLGQTTCRAQAPLDAKAPCGPDQKWWVTAAADREWLAMQKEWTQGKSKTAPKALPERCEQIRTAP